MPSSTIFFWGLSQIDLIGGQSWIEWGYSPAGMVISGPNFTAGMYNGGDFSIFSIRSKW